MRPWILLLVIAGCGVDADSVPLPSWASGEIRVLRVDAKGSDLAACPDEQYLLGGGCYCGAYPIVMSVAYYGAWRCGCFEGVQPLLAQAICVSAGAP